ncbi:hypothetical protein Tsubulata_028088 [Turnera subulata]|uniref:RBR-type E3 ubiquitin transferase n=1 Tax=Turnera subulata TaxID=218843 RepID=A0A9Q0JDH1_9ROSI|nr:hypothetical protein Tsubulata_028088 [Turnera subulata]
MSLVSLFGVEPHQETSSEPITSQELASNNVVPDPTNTENNEEDAGQEEERPLQEENENPRKRKATSEPDNPPKKQQLEEGEQVEEEEESATEVCIICREDKRGSDMFRSNKCDHDSSYCKDCVTQHVIVRLEEKNLRVTCLDLNCEAVLEPEDCRSFLPDEDLDEWEEEICLSVIPEAEKYYCPNKRCSVLLIRDGCEDLTETKCPHCRKQFCVRCNVPMDAFHEGLTCEKFQENMRDGSYSLSDDFATRFMEKNGWIKCPDCSFYVEKVSGCDHVWM